MPEVQKTTWIFACHDYNRVSAMSMFGNMAQYFSDEYAISTVKSRFSIPEYQPVRFVKPNEWGAPNVTATQVSFDVDMTAVNGRISQFLLSQGCSNQNISIALNTLRGIPNPNLGILLLCVDLPSVYPQQVAGRPDFIPASTPKAEPEYRLTRAVWASAGIFALSLLMLLFFTIMKKAGPIIYPLDAFSLLIFALIGCGLFMLMQRGTMYKLIAAFTFVISCFFEIVRMQFLMTMAVNIRRLFDFSSPAYVQNIAKAAIPFAIVAVLGILFLFLIRTQIGKKLKITAWICSAGILIYFIIVLIPQFPHIPPKNLMITIVNDIICVMCLPICVHLLDALSSIKRNTIKVSTGAIVWLSICIAFTTLILIPMLYTNTFNVISLIFSLLGITGYILILCRNRAGFLISVFSVGMTVFLNIQIYLGQDMLTACLSLLGFINPLITWLLIRDAWNDRTNFGQTNYMQISNR